MTTSSILRLVGRRANKLSTSVASHPTVIRSFSAAPASTAASSTNNSEADIRGAAAVMVAAAAATGAGLISWKSEKADCTAITAVVGKNGFGASKYLLDGLEKIQTRGYDGAGMATMKPTGGTMVSAKSRRFSMTHLASE